MKAVGVKASELREKPLGDLKALSGTLREELFRARMQHATGQLSVPGRLGALRKDIARVETVLHERQAQG